MDKKENKLNMLQRKNACSKGRAKYKTPSSKAIASATQMLAQSPLVNNKVSTKPDYARTMKGWNSEDWK